MTVVVILDTAKDEEVLKEVKNARCVIFINRNRTKNSEIYKECRKLVRNIGIASRSFTFPKSMSKKETEDVAVAIGRVYTSGVRESVIFADDRLVVY